MKKIKEQIRELFNSVKIKLFLTLSLTILAIIIFLIIVNNFALEKFYLFSKEQTLKSVYEQLNEYYKNSGREEEFEQELEKIAIKNNFDILIKDNNGINIYSTNKNFSSVIGSLGNMIVNSGEVLETTENFTIKRQRDIKNGISYIILSGNLENGYFLHVRMPITSIQDSVKISNNFLIIIAGFVILISAIVMSIISKKFTEPILELSNIAQKMSNLDFSQKYKITTKGDDEINTLARSINTMSDKLEGTIKQLRNSNNQLERDIEEKSKIDEMRKSFISDVSHELKTPITSIMGYADTLLEEEYDKETQSKFLNVIASEARRMAKLVTDLLTLSKNDNNRNVVKKEQFDLGELVKKCQDKLAIEIKRKNHNVNCFVTADVPLVYADKDDIERVVLNIMTNSIKYTKDGGEIKIYVGFVYNDAYIKIFDNGIGIPEEDLSRIFERFYRVDKARSREMGGTGLGLSIAKDLLDRNGGSIDIKSEVGKGTEVVIKVPTKEK